MRNDIREKSNVELLKDIDSLKEELLLPVQEC